MKLRILVVDDEPDICKALLFLLNREGYSVAAANSGEQALEKLKEEHFDVVLTDLKMGQTDGMAVLEKTRETSPSTAVIMMTAFASVESAIEAMKKGAADYIVKPFHNEEIKLTIRRILEQKRLVTENIALKQQISQRLTHKDVVASSASMLKIFDTIEKVSLTKSNILILGESGTGKGLIAEIIHSNSPRRGEPFISINCSAIPEGLLESELFGYRKGAFTGAVSDKIGLIPLAHKGTFFLDEIGDMPVALQSKLLKVLETGEVSPLGDTKPRLVDVRIIAATNADIENKIAEGKFRKDLYWRLNVIEIKVPPLRERKDDVELLCRHFTGKFAGEHNKNVSGIDSQALAVLIDYSWPGNVRELSNVIERSVVLAEGMHITLDDLPDRLKKTDHGQDQETSPLKAHLGECERSLIVKAYVDHNKNKDETAKSLGVDLATLYRKLKKYGIEAE
ncbi:MAG: sigma-54 dependent transcriptional regulator [Dissulfurispiraceae bacterium]|jgi:DNA-binding NtrC family response regulator